MSHKDTNGIFVTLSNSYGQFVCRESFGVGTFVRTSFFPFEIIAIYFVVDYFKGPERVNSLGSNPSM